MQTGSVVPVRAGGAALGLAFALVLGAPSPLAAEPTHVEVRVLSQDAKFVGTSMGGARVVLRDADTREILAEGVTQGTTGDTRRIMREPQPHHAPVATPEAAVFRATLDLDEPRRIEVEARGPLAQPQATGRATSTMWVVPGRHVRGGDGWLLELPGFAVDVLAPAAHGVVDAGAEGVDVEANVTLMCGCPITPGGLWDADRYVVRARIRRDGARIGEVPLAYAGTTSRFAGRVELAGPGAYELIVYAHDPQTGNTGLDRTTFLVPGR